MKPTIRSLGRTVGISGLLCVVALAGSGCGERTQQDYLERAELAMEKGEYRDAVIDYRNALQRGGDAAIRGQLGLAMKKEGDSDGAIRHLRRALDEEADPDRYALPLAQLLVQTRQGAEVLDLPRPNLDDEAQGRFLAHRAIGGFMAGEETYEQARSDLEQAQELAPEQGVVQLASAYEALSRGNQPEASVAVDRATRASPELALAWSFKGDLARSRENLDEALEAYERAVELRSGGIMERLSRGSLRLELGDLEGAQQDAEFVREGAPDHPGGHFLAGLVAFQQDRRDEARQRFESALSQHSRYRAPMPYLAQLHLDAGNLRQAERNLERYHALGPGNARSYTLLARLRVEQGQPEQALDTLTEAVEDQPGLREELGLYLAALYLDTGQAERGVETLRGLLEAGQDTATTREMLGLALTRQGDREGGVEMLESAAAADDQARRADIALVAAHLQEQRFDEALKAAERLREKDPDNADGYSFHAVALLGQEDMAGARRVLREGMEQLPGHPGLAMNLSALALMSGDVEDAVEVLEAVQDERAGEPTTGFRLVAIHRELDDESAAQEGLEALVEHNPEDIGVLVRAAEVYLEMGRPERSTALVEQALAEDPESPQLHYRLARNHALQGERQAAIEALEDALDWEPQHAPARIALTRQLGLAGQIDKAREVLSPLLEERGDEPAVRAQEAFLYLREDRFEEAAERYGRVLEEEQRRSWVVEAYQALIGAGRHDEAFERLSAWLEEQPEDSGVRHTLASGFMEQDRQDQARGVYEEQLDQQPEDVIALNNLAWLYRDEDPEKAMAYARQAHELAPEQVEVLDTYGVILLDAGEAERSVEILQEAWKREKERPEIGVNLARALMEIGDRDQARDLLSDLLQEHESFEDRQEAEQMLGETQHEE
ncbi:MAG: XrtA/PEP-CTERM system TPR-repeat protein PrsT [Halorhodospira sp.]